MTWIILSGPIVVYNGRVRGAASKDATTTVGIAFMAQRHPIEEVFPIKKVSEDSEHKTNVHYDQSSIIEQRAYA